MDWVLSDSQKVSFWWILVMTFDIKPVVFKRCRCGAVYPGINSMLLTHGVQGVKTASMCCLRTALSVSVCSLRGAGGGGINVCVLVSPYLVVGTLILVGLVSFWFVIKIGIKVRLELCLEICLCSGQTSAPRDQGKDLQPEVPAPIFIICERTKFIPTVIM